MWRRLTAARLLCERQDTSVIPQLRSRFEASKNPVAKISMLHLLHGLDALEDDLLLAAVGDAHPQVRCHGLQLSESRFDAASAVLALRKFCLPPGVACHPASEKSRPKRSAHEVPGPINCWMPARRIKFHSGTSPRVARRDCATFPWLPFDKEPCSCADKAFQRTDNSPLRRSQIRCS